MGWAAALLLPVAGYSPRSCFYGNWQILRAVSAAEACFQADHCLLGGDDRMGAQCKVLFWILRFIPLNAAYFGFLFSNAKSVLWFLPCLFT